MFFFACWKCDDIFLTILCMCSPKKNVQQTFVSDFFPLMLLWLLFRSSLSQLHCWALVLHLPLLSLSLFKPFLRYCTVDNSVGWILGCLCCQPHTIYYNWPRFLGDLCFDLLVGLHFQSAPSCCWQVLGVPNHQHHTDDGFCMLVLLCLDWNVLDGFHFQSVFLSSAGFWCAAACHCLPIVNFSWLCLIT